MEIRSVSLVSDSQATNASSPSSTQTSTQVSEETKNPAIELVSDPLATKDPSAESGIKVSGEFSDFIKSALGGDGKKEVSEEELFSGLLEYGLSGVSKDASKFYAEEKIKLLTSMRKPNGNVSHEEVAIMALSETVNKGLVTKSAAEKINGEAFKGAQLDANMDSLFDHIGSDTDLTKAVASLDDALIKAKTFMDSADKSTAEARPLESGATGRASSTISTIESRSSSVSVGGTQNMSIGGGFVWKPISESDKKLAVVLPEVLANIVSKVEIHSSLPPSEATKIAEGRFAGNANGGRPHFRFEKAGGAYGDDLHLVAYKNDGTTLSWDIKDGSKRYD